MSLVLDEAKGTITVTASALAAVVTRAAESVDGTRVRKGRRRLDVDVADGRAHVRLELSARHGLVLPQLAREVQEQVAAALSTMCDVTVEAVDIFVEEVA